LAADGSMSARNNGWGRRFDEPIKLPGGGMFRFQVNL
jgi:hypothetical protein